MRIAIDVLPHVKLFGCMVGHQSKLHQLSPLAQLSSPLQAPIRMTGEKRSIRQPSANLQEFQVGTELSSAPTVWHMSPEQVEGKDLDVHSDVFFLGTVLYEMLTGKRAFEGKSQLSVASAILEKEPEPISAVKPMTPAVLDHAVRKCLAKLPEERWQSASDLSSELKWIQELSICGRMDAG